MTNDKLTIHKSDFTEIEQGNESIARALKLFKSNKVYMFRGKPSTELFFHSDWNWLNAALEVIETLGYDTAIIHKQVDDKVIYIFRAKKPEDKELFLNMEGDKKITVVWSGVIFFFENYKGEIPKLQIN
jgi:hypothetical protein